MVVELVDIRTVESDGLGRLSFFEAGRDVPFEIKRIYYIYNTPEEAQRGGHAHRQLTQMLTCLYGTIEIVLDDGEHRESVLLDDPSKGLIVRDMTWREMIWRKADSVLGVAASSYYDEDDYIRDYGVFLDEIKKDKNVRSFKQ